jgi:hypothetical protein
VDTRERRARAIQANIRKVLNESWDPLAAYSIGPDDEYDSLIGPIYHILQQKGSIGDIIKILVDFEKRTGGQSSDLRTLNRVAEELMALDVRL